MAYILANQEGDLELSDTGKIRNYFNRIAVDFDSIYSSEKGVLRNILDTVFRKTMRQRFSLVFEKSGDVKGKRVLDVGCGSGQYCLEFARRGTSAAVGIDLSESMLRLAESHAEQNRLNSVCQFIHGNFLAHEFRTPFHIVVAIGLFDYIEDPVPTLSKLKEVSNKLIMASFPVKWDVRTPIRKLRLALKKCDVYFYTLKRIEDSLNRSGFSNSYEITKLDRDYFVLIDCD